MVGGQMAVEQAVVADITEWLDALASEVYKVDAAVGALDCLRFPAVESAHGALTQECVGVEVAVGIDPI